VRSPLDLGTGYISPEVGRSCVRAAAGVADQMHNQQHIRVHPKYNDGFARLMGLYWGFCVFGLVTVHLPGNVFAAFMMHFCINDTGTAQKCQFFATKSEC
jgi:hypothetical protein